ncbi:MAG: ATP-binding protein, partial [Gallionella sp.]|nr:ATP-binding protein [Gallionella sp.]
SIWNFAATPEKTCDRLMEKYTLPPRAASLSESMRDIGYSLETAIADIIDNSIAANATRIDIWIDFNTGQPRLGVTDNGSGLNRQELMEATRQNPI